MPSPEDAIKVYLKEEGLAIGDIGAVCLSVAGPVSGDEFKFTNNHWRLSKTAFCKTLQVDELLLVNDFSAMALGMTRLQPDEFRVVCPGTPEPLRPAVVIGPGTGLGVGTLLDLGGGRWAALPGEGGHVDLPLSSPRETQLWQHIYNEIGHVSAETRLERWRFATGVSGDLCGGRSRAGARHAGSDHGCRLGRRPGGDGSARASSASGWAAWRAITC